LNSVSGKSSYNPFVRLLPITDRNTAHADFVNIRMNGVDVSGDAAHALLPPSQGKKSPVSAQEKKQHYEARILSHWPYIFAGCLVFVLALVGFCVWRCCRRRKLRKAKQMNTELGLRDAGNKNSAYWPLQDPNASTTSINKPVELGY
jgi:hypothetical protein